VGYSLLLAEDSDSDAALFSTMLQELQASANGGQMALSTQVERVASLEAVVDRLATADQAFDVVLLDLNLPDSTGLATLDCVLEADSDVAVVVLTGVGTQELGRQAVERGAQDFLIKDNVTPRVLTKTVAYAETRKAQTQEIERQRDELSVLNWLVRHEFRNNASVILGWADQFVGDSPQERRAIDRMTGAAEDIVRLTKSVGDLVSTQDTDRSELDDIQLQGVVEAEVDQLRERAGELSISPPEPSDGPSLVLANQFLGTVIRTVLRNALERNDTEVPTIDLGLMGPAAPTGETALSATDRSSEYLWLEISDDGPGFSESTREHLLDEAYPERPDGTGIGLFLVGRFMTQYGGAVEIDDNDPRGATIRLGFVPA
jgi:signal transduction histidine kinase